MASAPSSDQALGTRSGRTPSASRSARRQRRPAKSNVTLDELRNWWLNERCPKKSADRERSRVEKHVIKQPIGSRRLPEVTPSLFDDRLREMEEAGASAASLNKLHAIVDAVFEQAIAASKWRGTNPISAVPTRKVPQRIYETLSLDEVRLVINAAGPTWRNLIATALYLGLRKGELLASEARRRSRGATSLRPTVTWPRHGEGQEGAGLARSAAAG